MLAGVLATLTAILGPLLSPKIPPSVPEPPAAPPAEMPSPAPVVDVEPRGPTARVITTAYCLTGRMANGLPAHVGAVASNRHPIGTRLWLHDSPWGTGEFVVQDRIGWGSELDFAMPGDCRGARRWGRRTVGVNPV